jgi:hypothetical protein
MANYRISTNKNNSNKITQDKKIISRKKSKLQSRGEKLNIYIYSGYAIMWPERMHTHIYAYMLHTRNINNSILSYLYANSIAQRPITK